MRKVLIACLLISGIGIYVTWGHPTLGVAVFCGIACVASVVGLVAGGGKK